jgi:type I restriction enzyme R subunit
MQLIVGIPKQENYKEACKASIVDILNHFDSEDKWYEFRGAANHFLYAYGDLEPDPRILLYKTDVNFIATILAYERNVYAALELELPQRLLNAEIDWRQYSEKIRSMLNEHLEVKGLKQITSMKSINDPEFWDDFNQPADIQTAAVRKMTELKREVSDRLGNNPLRYERFSDRIKEVIQAFNQGLHQLSLDLSEQLANDLQSEDNAHTETTLSPKAYDVYKILEQFQLSTDEDGPDTDREPSNTVQDDDTPYGSEPKVSSALQEAAIAIDTLYTEAPRLWQDKRETKKALKQRVRRIVKEAELEGWKKEIPNQVEEYALKEYPKT